MFDFELEPCVCVCVCTLWSPASILDVTIECLLPQVILREAIHRTTRAHLVIIPSRTPSASRTSASRTSSCVGTAGKRSTLPSKVGGCGVGGAFTLVNTLVAMENLLWKGSDWKDSVCGLRHELSIENSVLIAVFFLLLKHPLTHTHTHMHTYTSHNPELSSEKYFLKPNAVGMLSHAGLPVSM